MELYLFSTRVRSYIASMSYRFYTVDVFTERPFAGNPLAVFPEADGLSDAQMQSIARELNLSETSFVFPPDDATNTRRVRIFTPSEELPFAGHPTLGTAHVLVTCGAIATDGTAIRVVFEEGVGPIEVLVTNHGARTSAQFSVAQLPIAGPPPPSREALASVLSISPDAIARDVPVEAMSCGVPYLFVPVTGLEIISSIRIDPAQWQQTIASYWANAVYVWTRETAGDAEIHARMFFTAPSILEDPATGSAAAAFAGHLGTREGADTGTVRWRIEQGVEMQRASLLEVEADKQDGRIVAVRVGGASVSISRGEMEV